MQEESLLKTILFTLITFALTIIPTPVVRTVILFLDVSVYWIRAGVRKACGGHKRTITQILKKRLSESTSATEYALTAFELDRVSGNTVWKDNLVSRRYDYALIRERVNEVRGLRCNGDVQRLMSLLRAGVLRNFGGISNSALYDRTYAGTKVLIEEYNYEMVTCVKYVERSFNISSQDKLDFFHDAKTTLGMTALCLHGGAMFGMTHIGVIEGLIECELLPNVIVGSGVGAGVAAIACIGEWESIEISNENFDKVELLRKGLTIETYCFLKSVLKIIGGITFKEAFLKTRRILNIIVYPESERIPKLLNYLTTPYVSISEAINCSMGTGILEDKCLITGFEESKFYPPYEISEEAPFNRITELFNVNHFIISLSRPYLKPLILPRCLILTRLIAIEIKHLLRILNYFKILNSTIKWILFDEEFSLEGSNNVTIVPHGNKWILWEIIGNLIGEGNGKYWIDNGKRSIYEKRWLLETRMRMEFLLNDYYEKYRNK